ncbi:MAG: hypothetical protein PF637_04465 [Spirochaetes bacterium]|jgi:hypothetical protein|nr:hypothetical protein [Spirochaetota bacterium]
MPKQKKISFNSFLTTLAYFGVSPTTKLKKITDKNISFFIISHNRCGIVTETSVENIPIIRKKKHLTKIMIKHAMSQLISQLNSVNACPLYFFPVITFPAKTSEDTISQINSLISSSAETIGSTVVGGTFEKSKNTQISISLYAYGEAPGKQFLSNESVQTPSTIYTIGLGGRGFYINNFLNSSNVPSTDYDPILLTNDKQKDLLSFIMHKYNPYYFNSTNTPLINTLEFCKKNGKNCLLELDTFPVIPEIDKNNITDLFNHLLKHGSEGELLFISKTDHEQELFETIPITPIGKIFETISNKKEQSICLSFNKKIIQFSNQNSPLL